MEPRVEGDRGCRTARTQGAIHRWQNRPMGERAVRQRSDPAPEEPVEGPWRPGPVAWGAVAVAVLVLALGAGYAFGKRPVPPSTVDVGFLQDMIDHHGQAIVMGKTLQTAGGSPEVEHFANEIVASQLFETGKMLAWLEAWGLSYGDPDRRVMTWMGHGSPLEEMPGMATEAQVQRINELDGRVADELFVRLMIHHHRGGIAMAEFAERQGRAPKVKDLAARIARYQAVEIRELEAVRAKLGLTP